MARYVFRDGCFRDPVTNEPMSLPDRAGLAVPMVTPVMPEYASPIDGRAITTRHERREDLKRNNCVPYEPSMSPTKGKFRNPHFAKKWGVQLSEEFR